MLYFFVCADEAVGVARCRERGWVQVGAGRFYTPERDDVRVIRRFVDLVLMPGGTFLMAGPDFADHPQRGMFENLVDLGAAQWAKGEEPKAVSMAEPEFDQVTYETPAPARVEAPLMSVAALKETILGKPTPRPREPWSPGGSRTLPPSRR